jgi:hypothetical protein
MKRPRIPPQLARKSVPPYSSERRNDVNSSSLKYSTNDDGSRLRKYHHQPTHISTAGAQSAKYEFASSNTTRMTFAFDTCFVWKLASLADERSGFFIENQTRRLTRSSTY